MLGEISSYYVNNSASVRVITQAGVDRPATDGEWLALWRTQPALTLEIYRRETNRFPETAIA